MLKVAVSPTLFLVLLLLFTHDATEAQLTPYYLLAAPNTVIQGDVVRTEQVLDLVHAYVADSVIEKRKEEFRGFGGWMFHYMLGRYWEAYTMTKQRYVGSSTQDYVVFDGLGDELDVNIFIMPHLERYINMVRTGFDIANKKWRSEKPFRLHQPDSFPLPPELKYKELGYITVECEVTPPMKFREQTNRYVFPMIEQAKGTGHGQWGYDTLPNFGVKHPSFGMTGTWCMDCNHNCRPEIHPIEWLWWLDFAHKGGSDHGKSWMLTMMRDGSDRFDNWAQSPMAGEIAVPFVFPSQAKGLDFKLDILFGDPVEDGRGLPMPAKTYAAGNEPLTTVLALNEGTINANIAVEAKSPDAVTRYWISPPQKVPHEDLWVGYFHLSTTVANMFSARLTFDYSK
jgi:hypothetical protein